MTEFEKMQQGLEYDALAPEFSLLRDSAFELLQNINKNQFNKAKPYFKKLLQQFGENSVICPPFICEYGKTISVGIIKNGAIGKCNAYRLLLKMMSGLAVMFVFAKV